MALLAGESLITYLDRPISRPKVARGLGLDFDERRAVEVIEDLRSQGIDAYTLISPNQFLHTGSQEEGTREPFPLAGLSGKTTVLCNESGSFITYVSDRRGFRNPSGPLPEPAGVVLLGDSFAHGFCVADGEDIAGQLRKSGMGVINLGMNGSGPLIELAIYREYAESLRPHTVFWLYYEGNDLNDLHAEVQVETLTRYLRDERFSQRLEERQREIDGLLHRYFRQALRTEVENRAGVPPGGLSRLLQGGSSIVQLKAVRRRISSLRTADSWRAYRAVLRDILSQIARRLEGRLVFVYLPAKPRYSSPLVAASYRRDDVLSMVEGLDIPILDLHPVFLRSGDPRSFFSLGLGPHYNEKGYAAVAREIRRHLESNPRFGSYSLKILPSCDSNSLARAVKP